MDVETSFPLLRPIYLYTRTQLRSDITLVSDWLHGTLRHIL